MKKTSIKVNAILVAFLQRVNTCKTHHSKEVISSYVLSILAIKVFIVFVIDQAETFKYTNECLCFCTVCPVSTHLMSTVAGTLMIKCCRKDRESSQGLSATNTFVEFTGSFNSLKVLLVIYI